MKHTQVNSPTCTLAAYDYNYKQFDTFPKQPAMDLSLTPEHEMTHQMMREFAEREVAPIIKEYDRSHPLRFTHYALD